jgi:hypothetical protein
VTNIKTINAQHPKNVRTTIQTFLEKELIHSKKKKKEKWPKNELGDRQGKKREYFLKQELGVRRIWELSNTCFTKFTK